MLGGEPLLNNCTSDFLPLGLLHPSPWRRTCQALSLCTLKVLTISSQGGQNDSLVWPQVDGRETAFTGLLRKSQQQETSAILSGQPSEASLFLSLPALTPASWDHFPPKAAQSH